MCGGCGHGHWECSNKYAIPYEEWAMIHEEEKKSSCDQFVNEEDVFDIPVKDEDDVFVEEPASNAQEESHYNDSFLIHDDFVDECDAILTKFPNEISLKLATFECVLGV
ncbi:unnamed protein product [Cuscuta campestris]|uniref:Uncharacterized protein n=1 Tax=Cuscuta campestris TaxID=132261 RepID=A0A484NEL8_9ASTE|nr:unnamed protein product [Cuscuta campestris]